MTNSDVYVEVGKAHGVSDSGDLVGRVNNVFNATKNAKKAESYDDLVIDLGKTKQKLKETLEKLKEAVSTQSTPCCTIS